MKTSVIIPCYWLTDELKDFTKNCLNSLRRSQRPDEVIVVDDGSPLRMSVEADVFIRTAENYGFPHAVNQGLKLATGDVIIIANNDVTFTQGWLDAILKPIEEGYGISSILIDESDGIVTENKIEENKKFGSLWAMTRETYNKLGGLDERFGKGTFEDTDYWLRAKQSKIRIGKNMGHYVHHEGRATFNVVDPEEHWFNANQEIYKEKHGRID